MKLTILPGAEQDNERTQPVRLAAVLLYEDTDCGSRAKAALDRVMSRLPSQGVCALDLWPFELLDYPLLRREAAVSAARSAVVVLCLHGDRPLTPGVKSWLDLWLGQADRPDQALAVLMDEGQRRAPAVIETLLRLHRASQQGGVRMFLSFEKNSPGAEPTVTTGGPTQPAAGFPLPTEAVHRLEECSHNLAWT